MDITAQSIIGELVAQDYRTASVFQSYGIDFCCKGNRTISDVCTSRNIALNVLVEALQVAIVERENQAAAYHSWPLDLLADYIEKIHHHYVETKTGEIIPFLQKIVKVHGDRHPELAEVERQFLQAAGELAAHMKKEELVLFPFIRKMVKAKAANEPLPQPHFGTISNPITMMHREHDTEGERFREMARLTENYVSPHDACHTYRVTFSMLKEFEEDLHFHIHLENNILFPKALEMEKTLLCTT